MVYIEKKIMKYYKVLRNSNSSTSLLMCKLSTLWNNSECIWSLYYPTEIVQNIKMNAIISTISARRLCIHLLRVLISSVTITFLG
jgi:hypothetical protein